MRYEDKGRQALEFIRTTIATRGYPPSRREVAAHLNCVPSTAQRVLEAIRDRGEIEIDPGEARGVRVTGKTETEAM